MLSVIQKDSTPVVLSLRKQWTKLRFSELFAYFIFILNAFMNETGHGILSWRSCFLLVNSGLALTSFIKGILHVFFHIKLCYSLN